MLYGGVLHLIDIDTGVSSCGRSSITVITVNSAVEANQLSDDSSTAATALLPC